MSSRVYSITMGEGRETYMSGWESHTRYKKVLSKDRHCLHTGRGPGELRAPHGGGTVEADDPFPKVRRDSDVIF